MQSINDAMQPNSKVPVAAFAARYRSKREVFNFLSGQCKCYLCDYDCLSIYFLKQLVMGTSKISQ